MANPKEAQQLCKDFVQKYDTAMEKHIGYLADVQTPFMSDIKDDLDPLFSSPQAHDNYKNFRSLLMKLASGQTLASDELTDMPSTLHTGLTMLQAFHRDNISQQGVAERFLDTLREGFVKRVQNAKGEESPQDEAVTASGAHEHFAQKTEKDSATNAKIPGEAGSSPETTQNMLIDLAAIMKSLGVNPRSARISSSPGTHTPS